MGVADFRELQCWQLANELKKEVYAFTAVHPAATDRDFCQDVRRSARSAPANIAEGFGRYTHREFAHFLSIALASLTETRNHLQHAFDCEHLRQADYLRLSDVAIRASKATMKLHGYLLRTPRHRPGRA